MVLLEPDPDVAPDGDVVDELPVEPEPVAEPDGVLLPGRVVVPGEADGVLPVPPPTRSVSAWLQAVRPTSNARAKKPEIIFFIWVLLPCGVFDRCRMGATGVPPGLT